MRKSIQKWGSLTLLALGACETTPEGLSGNGGDIPLFVVAGQSNAEGNVRVSGIEALRAALPTHSNALSESERSAARAAFKEGVGDWCNPGEDYSDAAADASIDALRAGGLDLSPISNDYTLPNTHMAAHRWRFQEDNAKLDEPYENPDSGAHLAHTNGIAPFGVGFGVWDDEETQVMFYGPELGFGMHIAQTEGLQTFELVKIAMGGSSLYGHWAPNGSLREQLYAKTNAYLTERPETSVAGLLWFQGFNDQFEDKGVNNYADNLTRLIQDFRDTYGASLPVVVVQARKVGDLALIAEAQESVSKQMEGVGLAESEGLTECFHYDAASQLVVGQRSGVEMLRLLSGE
jgi:hypothetical protein